MEILDIGRKNKEMCRVSPLLWMLLAFSQMENTGEPNMSYMGRKRGYNGVEGLQCVRQVLFVIKHEFLGVSNSMIVGKSCTLNIFFQCNMMIH